MMSVPQLLDGLALEQRLLLALRAGPQRMPALCLFVGIEDSHAGRLRIIKVLAALRRRGRVRRVGSRHTSAWKLARDRRDPPPLAKRRSPGRSHAIRPPLAAPGSTRSWWLVPEPQFAAVARGRADEMGWRE